jgi:hypothetical protein
MTKTELLKKQRDNNPDGYFNYCERCGKPKPFKLDEHHIIMKSEKPKHKELDNERNKILLCSDMDNGCHSWYHAKKSRRNDLIDERKLEELFGNNIKR